MSLSVWGAPTFPHVPYLGLAPDVALHLLKLIAQGEQDYRAGQLHDQESVDALITARLAERRRGA